MNLMDDLSVFDKLVHNLSGHERREMLDRIRSSVEQPQEDGAPPEEPAVVDLELEYRKLGPLRRLVVLLTALFTGRERSDVVEQMLLRALARKVRDALPESFDATAVSLLPAFAMDVGTLAGHARHFASVSHILARSRTTLVAFLFGLQAPSTQEELLHVVDLREIASAQPSLSDYSIKKHALASLDDLLAAIGSAKRQEVYHDVRLLHHLAALATYQFDHLVATFDGPAGQQRAVPASRLAEELGKLAAILRGLWRAPSSALLEAICLYEHGEALSSQDGEATIQALVIDSQRAAAGIRAFVSKYPLADIIRLANRRMNYSVAQTAGGEDWFAQLRSFWRERIEDSYKRFVYERKQAQLLSQAAELLEVREVERFPGYPAGGPDGPTRHAVSLGLLRELFGPLYQNSIAPPLAQLFRDGQFYKADNRREFDEAYHEIDRVQTDIANFSSRLRPQGDFGASLENLMTSELSEEALGERRAEVYSAIDREAERVLKRAIDTLRALASILGGVLYGEVGGRYDTISNIGEIGGRSNSTLIHRLELCQGRLKSGADLIADLYNLETLTRDQS